MTRVSGPDAVTTVVDALRRGEVVAIPTDTVYGLAARADDASAVRRLAELKGRAPQQPVQLLVSGVEAVEAHLEVPGVLESVRAWWPGAITAVVRVRPGFAAAVVTPEGTIGMRHPDDALAQAVIDGSGGWLAATSANRHGERPAATAGEVEATFGTELLILDGGPRLGGASSTVVDLTVEPPRILREGPVTAEMLGLDDD